MKNELPQAAIILADRCGKKIDKGRSDPFASSLHMTYQLDKSIHIEMGAFCSPYSNGNAWCKITVDDKLVYEGGGNYFSLGAGCKPKVYKPGSWEDKILNASREYVAKVR